MKLSVLRQLMQENDSPRGFSWLTRAWRNELAVVTTLRFHLGTLDDYDDNYELKTKDIWALLSIIIIDSNTNEFIEKIKNEIQQHVDIFIALKNAQLLTYHNFALCAQFTPVFDSRIQISSEQLATMLAIPHKRLQKFNESVQRLIEKNLFDASSFAQLLALASETLPQCFISTARKETVNLTINKIEIDNGPTFFMSRSHKYGSGTFGVIKIGERNRQRSYSIKKLEYGNDRSAQKEVRYHRLLGREAFYYKRNCKPRVVATWLSEKALESFKPDELIALPIETRLCCLRECLADLNILHSRNRVHGDVKAPNCILDPTKKTMRLIDFSGAQRASSTKECEYSTKSYCEPNGKGNQFDQDMYAMSLVSMFLFPEFYTLNFDGVYYCITYNAPKLTLLGSAMVSLIESMRADISQRCNSEDALAFCDALIAEGAALTDTRLNELIAKSIQRDFPTVTSVLRY